MGRTMVLGLMIGVMVGGLRWSQDQLRAQAIAAKAHRDQVEGEAGAAEGRKEVVGAVEEVAEGAERRI